MADCQEKADLTVVTKLKEEGLKNSKVMNYASEVFNLKYTGSKKGSIIF